MSSKIMSDEIKSNQNAVVSETATLIDAKVNEESMGEVNEALEGYQSDYTSSGFWSKVVKFARKAGKEVIEKSLVLYYVAQSDKTPLWAKTMVFGALGYFINAIDAVPDITPFVGFADDVGVMAAVITLVASFVSPNIKSQVDTKLAEWFSEESNDLNQAGEDIEK